MDSPNGGDLDEAQEKLFGESNSSGSKIEIKFVTDSKNGNSKINISEVKQVFVGMGKEELMEFANNPFWVRMRWFLFLLFWLIWFGMLGSAVAIILLAPKCPAQDLPLPLNRKAIYHLDLKNFKDASSDGIGDLQGLESKLDYFQDLGVDTILLDPLMKTAEGTEDVVDFKMVDPKFGTFDDLKSLVESAKKKGLSLMMKLVPNFSSDQHDWFNKSLGGEEPFRDYYVWTDPVVEKDGTRRPLTNWRSLVGGSAWTYSEKRNQYYLHQFGLHQPDLNFRNLAVKKNFEGVIKFWLEAGFKGLYLDKTEFLVEDSEFRDEKISERIGASFDDYDFYTHSHTANLQESWDILKEWSSIFKCHSAVSIVNGVFGTDVSDIVSQHIQVNKSLKSNELKKILDNLVNLTSSSAFELSCEDCSEEQRVALQLALLMLPGATIFPSGLELALPLGSIFQWNSTQPNFGFTSDKPWKPFSPGFEKRTVSSEKEREDSYYNFFKKIIQERKDSSVIQGQINLDLVNSTIFFTRSKEGSSPQYVVLLNFENSIKTVNLEEKLDEKLGKLSPLLRLGYNRTEYDGTAKNEVPGNSLAIYKFAAKSA